MKFIKTLLLATLFCTSCSKLLEYDAQNYSQQPFFNGTWILSNRLVDELDAFRLMYHFSEEQGASYVQLTFPDLEHNEFKTVRVPIEWEYIPNYGVRQGKVRNAIKITCNELNNNGPKQNVNEEYLFIKEMRKESVTMLLESGDSMGEATLVRGETPTALPQFPKELSEGLETDEVEGRLKASNAQTNNRWMSKMPDDVRLCNMLLPGSHDSATYGIGKAMQFAALCQKLDLREQFHEGVRVFDFRIREDENGELALYHNFVPCNITLKDAVAQLIECVKENPTETIIICNNTEHNDLAESLQSYTKPIVQLFNCLTAIGLNFSYIGTDEYSSLPKLKSQYEQQLSEAGVECTFETDIKLGDARGKVLVITRNKLGVGYGYGGYIRRWEYGWPLYGENTSSSFYGQEYIEREDRPDREQYLKANWYNFIELLEDSEKFTNPDNTSWFRFETSGYIEDISDIFPNYAEYAHEMTPKFMEALKSHYGKGIVIVDYVGLDSIHRIKASTCLTLMVSSLIVPPFFGLRQLALDVMLQIATKFSPLYSVRGAELTNLIVEKNFTKTEAPR